MTVTPNLNATVIVHWPGSDVPACPLHAAQLSNLGAMLGSYVSSTPCEPTTCTNCENAAKAKGGAL